MHKLSIKFVFLCHSNKSSIHPFKHSSIHPSFLTIAAHPLGDTFFEAAALAAVTAGAVDGAVALSGARVLHAGGLTSAEKAL